MEKGMDGVKGFIVDEIYYKKYKIWKHERQGDQKKNLLLKGCLEYILLNCSELVCQLKE